MENIQSEQDEGSDTEGARENVDIDAMTSENQKAVMDQLVAAHTGKQTLDLSPYQDLIRCYRLFMCWIPQPISIIRN